MSHKAQFSGAWCPSVIPFNAQGKVDYDALQQHFDRLKEAGTDGILLMGTIGEFVTMSLSEREELIKKARKMSALPMIAHVSTTCVDDMVHLADIAYAEGYDAVMALPHYYYAQTPKQLFEYYIDLDRRFKGKWLIYNFPARTGCDVDAALALKLVNACPNFVGIKDTVDCSSHTRLLVRTVTPVRPDFSIFAGFDEYFVPNLMNGGAGVLSGLNNVVPELFTQIKQAYAANDLDVVAALHEEIGRLSGIYAIGDDFVTTIKTVVSRKYKYMEPTSRNYGGVLNPEQLALVDKLFNIK
ncbi:MAG: dihydrodipicolinate synthase family protein [Enterobacteriaceae bacterium]|jgi:4-hydroxy-tetrahydrodipicolinate synthase|nr:dihydrodipicolinate synthase family protein [Enterobacteriaceae bacterium]